MDPYWFGIQIRIEIKKSWIRIPTETIADPQHWVFLNVTVSFVMLLFYMPDFPL